MGGFVKYLPFEASMALVGLVNLGGLPFSFGFFIKHYTLISVFDFNNLFIKVNLFIGMFSSLIYSYRLYYYVFFDTKKAKKAIYFGSSKTKLKSKFYSNSTMASCLAISLLLIVSCSLLSYMYFSFFIKELANNNLPFWSFNNKTFFLIQNSVENLNDVSTFINWFILYIGVCLLNIKFRYQQMYPVLFKKNIFIGVFAFFLFIVVSLFA